MTIFLSEHDAARLGLNGAKQRTTRGRKTRPDIPSAPAGVGDRIEQLRRIAAFGYSPRWDAGIGFCFWNVRTGQRTTSHQDYAAACVAAELEAFV